MTQSTPPRFIADAMLGRLARWLRVLGYDTAYRAHIADAELVQQARAEGRVVLTRDRALPRQWRLERYLLLHAEAPLAQVRQVVEAFGLGWQERLFSRCLCCNEELQAAPGQDVAARVPSYVRQQQQRFLICPHCRRIYWEGTHVAHMRRLLAATLPPA
ncbi:MAG: hypothetical protein KatS3mg131_3993 [Candidatus Tectimicrobiota bacterium]|nr:MAG: hypothetical protein KatS3mg131_3993 [Candidatus Tectomicrobia bacterium]